jgi:hypothetical protein
MNDNNFLILNSSSIDIDDFYEISLKCGDFLKKTEDYPIIKIPKKIDNDMLNIISQHYIDNIKNEERDYVTILEKLKERSYFEFFFVKKDEIDNSNEGLDIEKKPDITIEILEIFENDLTVQILPYSSLYKSANRKNYPTITCKFDLLKDIVNGADVGDLLLNYSAQLITNVLNEEKLDPNIYSKNGIVDGVIYGDAVIDNEALRA